MEKFDLEKHWKDFINGEFYVKCKTEELANEFLKYCHDNGLEWNNGESLIQYNNWNSNYKDNCYKYIGNDWGMVYEEEAETDIEFTGFKKELNEDTYEHIQKHKPPLGVMPKQIFEWHRVIELCRALHEYSLCEDVDQHLMIKWSDELNDRLYGLKGDTI